jgi:hypothetical protein
MILNSRRNRVLGAIFVAVAGVLAAMAFLPLVAGATTAICLIVALWLFWIGVRLFFTSRIQISKDQVSYRNRWGRQIIVSRRDIESVDVGRRQFVYSRSFPRLHLRSGSAVDLVFFEQPSTKAIASDSTVSRLVTELSPTACDDAR